MELFAREIFFIYLLAAAAVMVALRYFGAARKKSVIQKLFSAKNYKALVPPELEGRRKIADTLFLSALFFIFLAAAGPQWGREAVEHAAQYSQTIIALDVSNSMLARDVKPDRLSGAKLTAAMLLEGLQGARAGLMVFTSKAYLQAPVTTDLDALKTLSAGFNTDMTPVQGTELAPVLHLASRMLSVYPGKKALILITDGEDHNPADVQAALKTARESGIKVIAVGIGSAQGELIPQSAQDGGISYKKDKDGKTVLTKLDEQTLINFAHATGGVYIKYASPQQTADEIAAQLAALDRTAGQSAAAQIYKNRYQLPLFAAFILLLGYILLPLRKVK